jgi:hypothetical protein
MIAADFSAGYNIWTTDDSAKLGEVVAHFLPHLDYTITPIVEADQLIDAWSAARLIEPPAQRT